MKCEVIKSNLKYPLYACKFITDDLLLVAGGGGEGNNGIDNKITLLSIDNNKIKKFRELKLSHDNDSPTCMDFAHLSSNIQDNLSNSVLLGSDDIQDNIKVEGIFLLGCNENSSKIMQSNINNSLQRFNYENQHIRFIASVDYDQDEQSPRDLNTYMKYLKISDNIEFAACCTSKVPSVIRIINPITLNELYEIETGNELRDFDFQKGKQAKMLSYITKNTCELISCVTGTFITKSYQFDSNKYTPLKLKFIKEDCFFIILKNDISNKFELHLFSITGEIKLLKIHELKNLKFKGITSVDYSYSTDILAISGNDNSVNFFHLFYKQSNPANHASVISALANSKMKYLKKFSDLHNFAITKIAFNDSGSRLSTVSADNSVSIINIPKNFRNHKPTTKKILSFIFKLIILVLLCIAGKFTYENDLHIYTKDALLKFNDEQFQPLMKDKVIPFIKKQMNRNKDNDSEYFKFKENQHTDEFDQVTILSKDTVQTPSISSLSYSTSSKENSYTTTKLANQDYYDQVIENDDEDEEEAISYEDYLLSLNDIVSVDVTTSGYESQITSVAVTQSTDVSVEEKPTVVKEETEVADEVVVQEPEAIDEVVEEAVDEEPEVIAEEPEVIAEEPEVIAEEPEVIAEEPEVIAEEPEVIAEEPEVIAEEPEVIAEEPEVIAEEPEVIAEEVVEEEPKVIAEEVVDEEPEVIAEEPEVADETFDKISNEESEAADEEPEADVEIIAKTVSSTIPSTKPKKDVKIQTVPNVEEDIEEILKVTAKTSFAPTTVSKSKLQIQTVPNVEEDIEKILAVETETKTAAYPTPSATELPENLEKDEEVLHNNKKESVTEYEEEEQLQDSIESTVGELEALPTETPDQDTYDHDRSLRIEELLPEEVDVHLPEDVIEEKKVAEELQEAENNLESEPNLVEDITNAVEEETTSSEDPEISEQQIETPQEELEEDIQGASEYDEINEEARDSVITDVDNGDKDEELDESLESLYEENERLEEELALDEL
ncbi:hypothetical protein FOG51_02671 [Hanseniaspora uvarum]|nr:hypothetical protein FOG51_02671 [Hanseniaspora uvarum]